MNHYPIDLLRAAMLVSNSDTTAVTLLHRKQRRQHFLAAMLSGPTAIIHEQPYKPPLDYTSKVWSLHDKSNNWCREFLRFSKEQICELSVLLEIPDHFEGRYCAPPTTALAVVCFRLSWPRRFKDCVSEFGRERGWLCRVFNGVCTHLYERFQAKLEWDYTLLNPARLRSYCSKTYERGEPSGLVWGFIDGTHQSICRPRPETCNQELFYSGHKHDHSLQFLAVVTPDGLVASMYGPFEGRAGDWGMFKESGLQEKITGFAKDEEGEQLYVYGDKAFYLEQGVIGAYRAQRHVGLTTEELVFNTYMAKQRMSVEWGFGKITQYFEFNNLRKNMKIGLSPAGAYYFVSTLLTNCHTCYYGSKTGFAFECSPPSIREYFHITEDEDEVLNMYINHFFSAVDFQDLEG